MHKNKNSKGDSTERCFKTQHIRMIMDPRTLRAMRAKRYTPNSKRECERRIKQRHTV